MQIEDVAGIGLASGRTVQQQRDLAVGHGLLGQIVIDDQHVAALVHEILAHRRAGIGREIQHRRRLGGVGAHDDGIVHRPALFKPVHDRGHGRLLLSDRNIDTDHVLAALVEDRVDRDRGFAGLAVADDQLALAAADRDQRVDRLDAGHHRNGHRSALDDAGRRTFDRTGALGTDLALAVDGTAERVDHAAEHRLAHGHLHHAAGAQDGIALAHIVIVAEKRHADAALAQVHDHAAQRAAESQHLTGHDIAETRDAADTVGQ